MSKYENKQDSLMSLLRALEYNVQVDWFLPCKDLNLLISQGAANILISELTDGVETEYLVGYKKGKDIALMGYIAKMNINVCKWFSKDDIIIANGKVDLFIGKLDLENFSVELEATDAIYN